MKFRYLIVDEDGEVSGTNDEDLALHVADVDYLTVVDAQEGKVLGELEAALPEADPADYADDEGEDD